MNKTAIKNFAVWARRKLIADITYKAGLIGVSENGIAEPLSQSTKDMQFFDIGTKNYAEVLGNEIAQRNALVAAIKAKERDADYKTAFQNVVEEVAYTWFNRLIAVRFMEVNDYLPSRVRVLSSENSAKLEPDFVTTPFDTDLAFTPYEQDRVLQLKDENKLNELFRMLFIKQCNKLNEVLPELFEKTADYSELLLTISFTDKDGVVYHLTHISDTPEDDFNVSKEGQIEIIGWMYQYYNTEPKDEVFALLKKNVKITKERIPAATQLFTPDWIVRYMVENSLGRLWLEQLETQKVFDFEHVDFANFSFGESDDKHVTKKQDSLKSKWKYYLNEAKQDTEVEKELYKQRMNNKNYDITTVKLIDPCMGSGHILVYAFDVFMQIYESQGYTTENAAQSIVEHNLYGLDIDTRAYQLAYFAIMMKARKYDRRFLTRAIAPQVYCPKVYAEGAEYGSLLNVDKLEAKPQELQENEQTELLSETYEDKLSIWNFRRLLNQKYDVVVTNPPYMGSSGMSTVLSDYVKKNYPDSKSDLFACFIERCLQMAKHNGYTAMITQHAFMFLSSYEKLRGKLLNADLINMAHLGARAFEEIGGEVVQTTSFVMRKSHSKNYKGTYARLVDYNSQQGKEEAFLAKKDLHTAQQENFKKIPGSPIAYWVSEKFIEAFSSSKRLDSVAYSFQGMITGDNNYYLRLWHEPSIAEVKLGLRNCEKSDYSNVWVPYNKGGGFRRWYGYNDYLLRWVDNGKNLTRARTENIDYYFHEGVTWSFLTSGNFSCRYFPEGYLWDVAGSSIFSTSKKGVSAAYICALMNSKFAQVVFDVTNPTINYQVMNIIALPFKMNDKIELVEQIAKECITTSKCEYDSFETSWDFEKHPLLNSNSIQSSFETWEQECTDRFSTLKSNEEELNRIFIDIYGLQDELTPEVADKDVTVRRADLQRDIKSLISYAVGCMFGRYSLDVDGLAYAGGDWDSSKYTSFIPDADNVLPITDEEYFHDDIVGRFVEFIKTVYGTETLEENLDFIARALGNKGNTSREIIRNYFLNDFIKDHIKTYQKRPIYWMFDSGKQNGFKALIYMHRYNEDTTGKVRVDYLHKVQRVYESEIDRMQEIIENSTNGRDVADAEKRKEKLTKQLKETKDYDAKIAHLALSRIAIDLDDGVKVNYEKAQTGQDGKKIEILAKI